MHHHHARTHFDSEKCLLISIVGMKAASLLLLLRFRFLDDFMLMPHMFAVSVTSVVRKNTCFCDYRGW